jgi:predicted cation transporter
MNFLFTTEVFATICFVLALFHTFSVKKFQHKALQYKEGSVGENFFHMLGEIEVVFGLWALIFLIYKSFSDGTSRSVQYLESQNFTEPAFVFVIMTVCSTRPILHLATTLIEQFSKVFPFKGQTSFYLSCLIVGPLLGSFITEPAAMTVTALILLERFYKKGISQKLMYATLGLLFVNISIGGTLTPFAAPPVLMVAAKWNWDTSYMLSHFGWRAILAILLSTVLVTFRFKNELLKMKPTSSKKNLASTPFWVSAIHLIFLASIIATSHHMVVFMCLFLFFLGLVKVTQEYQNEIKLREALLVGFFLGGLVILGAPPRWWLEPLLTKLDSLFLYLGCIGLTAITDNAALTYLGSLVPNLSESSKYALVAGSVVGGGLTVIANAPNPAGYGILNSSLGKEGISPLQLFLHALIPTLIAGICFWF